MINFKLSQLFLLLGLTAIIAFIIVVIAQQKAKIGPLWQIRSIDTLKYSRDLAESKMNDDSFNLVIDSQISDISKTGANYVAIGTPYDAKFLPFLKKWVDVSRKYGLNVWFRGNFSGWEGWFNYQKIDRITHLKKVQEFILNNPDLFENGDIFTPCPECENGGEGDPRKTGDVLGFRAFLIDEYARSRQAFSKINKKVSVGYFSMNYDVAFLIMDKQTTKALGNIVTIDHYVAKPEKLISDIDLISQKSGGKVVLGEFGVPIPDIHGKMSETEQSDWIEKALTLAAQNEKVLGLNYWVSVGGSTYLWDEKGVPKKGSLILTKFFTEKKILK